MASRANLGTQVSLMPRTLREELDNAGLLEKYVPLPAKDFLARLFSSDPRSLNTLCFCRDQFIEGEICVFKQGQYKYTLLTSAEMLQHTTDSRAYHYFRLNYKDKNEKAIFSLHEPGQPDSAAKQANFMALGWLREFHEAGTTTNANKGKTERPNKRTTNANKGKSEGPHMRTTNYVLLWNLSTKPTSLWVVYDYETSDYFNYTVHNNLQEGDYHNQKFDGERCFKKYDENNPVFPHSHDNSERTFHNLFTDRYVNPPSPTSPQVQAPNPTPDQNPTPSKEPRLSKLFHSIPSLLCNLCFTNEDDPPPRFFFNLSTPFDLAMLAPDITKWDADHGFDVTSVKNCFDASRLCLGDSLRASRVFKMSRRAIDIGAFVDEIGAGVAAEVGERVEAEIRECVQASK